MLQVINKNMLFNQVYQNTDLNSFQTAFPKLTQGNVQPNVVGTFRNFLQPAKK